VPEDETELRRVIGRVISRILGDPVSLDLLQKMNAYGSPEKFLFWWFHNMHDGFPAYAQTLTNRELADSLDYNSVYAKSDMAKAVMIEAARRLRNSGETQFVESPPPANPPLRAEATAE
jgi:hypothetical protein